MEPTSSKYKVGTLLYDKYYGLGYVTDVHSIGFRNEYNIEFLTVVDDINGDVQETFSYVHEETIDMLYELLQTTLKENE